MTVCIAARSHGMLVLACDRMLTAGDIQFEPTAQKTIFVTTSIAIMLSGDSSFHTEVVTEVYKTVTSRVAADPDDWWQVKDVAELYLAERARARHRRASAAILSPLGLTSETFLASQKLMDPNIVESITRDLIRFRIPSVSTIVAGIDSDQLGVHPHIYTLHDDDLSCDDVTGFSSIGSGSRHAETTFMMSQHSWNRPLPETLLLTYSAKKNAEVAPGVGRETDMFLIGPELGRNVLINGEVISKLDTEYRQAKTREARAQKKANEEIKRYVEGLTNQPAVVPDQASKPSKADEQAATN